MLGLFLLYFLGKYFYQLAEKFKKNKWVFAGVGIASYYVGSFIAGIIIVIIMDLFTSYNVDEMDDLLLSVFALPFGLLSAWGLYALLEKNWKRKPIKLISEDILDNEMR